jgi:glycosyltransferase involved in cell wall biosynthesis
MTGSNFVTSSSNFENTLISENYNIDKSKIANIKPGVDVEIFSPDLSLKRENIFLSVGRIQEQKGQLKTISFLNNFKKVENDFVCYFVGGPSGKSGNEYFQELKENVIDLKLESHVEFLGDLPQYEIKELLNKSKLLIHTSQFETFGLVAIEANSMGVPVLTSNNGPLKEIIENNINGYSSDDLIDGKVNMFVKNLINDDFIYEKIMNSCIQKSTNYSWENTSNELLDLYQEAKLS